MQRVRKSILQVTAICDDFDLQTGEKYDVSEYTGTCFRVRPTFLEHLPFYSESKIFFCTNFHVVEEANERKVRLRTAAMGNSQFNAAVECVVPKLDAAILSITRGDRHDIWFSKDNPEDILDDLVEIEMYDKRIRDTCQSVQTVGFPQGLEEHLARGHLAGRGTADDDMLQLDMSINSGTSGSPLMDAKYRVIGLCTSSLLDSERIAFAVPAYCIINFFRKFYSGPFSRFPRWGVTLIPMTESFRKVHGIRGTGAVVHTVHPQSLLPLKKGDVIHSVGGYSLDDFGEIVDETRGGKVSMNNTELMLSLDNYDLEVTSGVRRTITVKPGVIDLKVTDSWRWWNPPTLLKFGPFTFQNLTHNLAEEAPTASSLELGAYVKQTQSNEEVVVISHIDPNSYVACYEHPSEFDRVLSINRHKIRGMSDLKKAVSDLHRQHANGEKYMNIVSSSGSMWFDLRRLIKKRKR